MARYSLALALLLLSVLTAAPAAAFSTPHGTSGVERGSSNYMTGDFTSTGSTYAGKGVTRSSGGYVNTSRSPLSGSAYAGNSTSRRGSEPHAAAPSDRARPAEAGWGILNLIGTLMSIGGTILLVLIARAISPASPEPGDHLPLLTAAPPESS